ncbi:hypothetical protein BLA29_004826 [Euroglyphus maynei]|uniref:Uncharacterized protein n=1 Tax=Euroglyphus maynei TaxID=6958 RepID=A0A1Y3BEE5_EURMA|nr:hypothetical protein BLA29_004826 [Euroglyphus maynei]
MRFVIAAEVFVDVVLKFAEADKFSEYFDVTPFVIIMVELFVDCVPFILFENFGSSMPKSEMVNGGNCFRCSAN